MPKKAVIKQTIPEPTYLGIPKDENDWLKYEGSCIIFAGIEKINKELEEDESDFYVTYDMEEEEITKNKLIEGLKSVGVKCEEISFKWADEETGQRCCKCIVYYNKPYQIYINDFFITGLTQFGFNPDSPLEFSLMKLLS
jgi:hypothetical protein